MDVMKKEYPVVFFASGQEFEMWLEKNSGNESGIWIKHAKKHTGIQSATREEVLEVALCFGWIDGQAKTFDEQYYLQKYTPRGKRSSWSKINRTLVTKLIKEKRMREAGMREIEAAKADGRWDLAYDSPKTMTIPEDFLVRLHEDKKAEAFYHTLNKTNLFAIGYRLQTAKKPETRERRMQVILTMLHEEKKFH